MSAADEVGVCPEFELFDLGQITTFAGWVSSGDLRPAAHASLVFGAPGGMPARLELLPIALQLIPHSAHWSVVCLTDDGRLHQAHMLQALAYGGDIRVGMEDCPYLPSGLAAKSNAQLVSTWASITHLLGRRLRTSQEVRAHFGGARHVG